MRRTLAFLLLVLFGLFGPLSSQWAGARAEEDPLPGLAQAIAASPNDAAAYDAYVQAALKLRRWDDAIAQLKIAVAKIPSYHKGWYKLAYAYRSKGSFSDAAAAYRHFSELEPDKADPYFGLAASLQGAGDREGAVVAYRRYLELEKSPDKQQFVAQAKAEIAKLAAPALVAAPAPVVASPRPPEANALSLRAAAERARKAGKLDEAALGYEKALAADPSNLDLHVELGDTYFAQKRYSDAARLFSAAVARDGGYALGWYDLAHAQARIGDHASSVKAYRAYIQLRPADPDPYYGLGQAYRAMGDNKNAAEAFRTYLKMEQRPESKRWLDQARQELDTMERSTPHSALDLKNPFDNSRVYATSRVYAFADEFLPPGDTFRSGAHERIVRELAADDILPVALTDDDAIDDRILPPEPTGNKERDRLARYAAALAAYRTALVRHADQVSNLYQRGTERVLANDLRGAQKAWSNTAVSDRDVEEARLRLEKARVGLGR